MKQCVLCILFNVFVLNSHAQTSFIEYQKKFPRVAGAIKAKEDTIKKQFIKAGLQWPPNDLYLRSFKFDSQLEVHRSLSFESITPQETLSSIFAQQVQLTFFP